MLPAVYCGLESSALPCRTETCEWNWVTGGNLQAMLVLQTIQKYTPKKMEMLLHGRMSLKLHHSEPSERAKERMRVEGERGRERISSLTKDDGSHSDADWANNSEGSNPLRLPSEATTQKFPSYFHMVHVKNQLKIQRPAQIFLTHFMHQNGLPQSVSQLALQARVRARAWRRGGGWGLPPGSHPHRQERWKQVCLCGNAAVMLLDTQQAAITLLGRLPQRPSLDITEMGQLVMG